jgi:hypothetical protein
MLIVIVVFFNSINQQCDEWRNDELNNRWKHARELKSRFNKLFDTIKTTQCVTKQKISFLSIFIVSECLRFLLRKLPVAIGLDVEVDLYVVKEGSFAHTVLKYLTVEDLTELLIVSRVNIIEVDKVSLEKIPIEYRASAISGSGTYTCQKPLFRK